MSPIPNREAEISKLEHYIYISEREHTRERRPGPAARAPGEAAVRGLQPAPRAAAAHAPPPDAGASPVYHYGRMQQQRNMQMKCRGPENEIEGSKQILTARTVAVKETQIEGKVVNRCFCNSSVVISTSSIK